MRKIEKTHRKECVKEYININKSNGIDNWCYKFIKSITNE